VRLASTEEEFEARWANFQETYGAKPKMQAYLQKEIYSLRDRWVLAWVDSSYHAGIMATSIGEAFHSMLADGNSANRSLSQLFKLIDGIVVTQAERHNVKCVKWDEELLQMAPSRLPGLVLPSIVKLLSRHAFEKMEIRELDSSRFSVHLVERSDVQYVRSWVVRSQLYPGIPAHHVSELDPRAVQDTAASRTAASVIQAALSRPGKSAASV
jgi:hypothetical protein